MSRTACHRLVISWPVVAVDPAVTRRRWPGRDPGVSQRLRSRRPTRGRDRLPSGSHCVMHEKKNGAVQLQQDSAKTAKTLSETTRKLINQSDDSVCISCETARRSFQIVVFMVEDSSSGAFWKWLLLLLGRFVCLLRARSRGEDCSPPIVMPSVWPIPTDSRLSSAPRLSWQDFQVVFALRQKTTAWKR